MPLIQQGALQQLMTAYSKSAIGSPTGAKVGTGGGNFLTNWTVGDRKDHCTRHFQACLFE